MSAVVGLAGYTYFLGLSPLGLGQELVADAALDGAAESVDAVVGLLGRQALKGLQDILVFLIYQVIGSVAGINQSSALCSVSGPSLSPLETNTRTAQLRFLSQNWASPWELTGSSSDWESGRRR